MASLDLLTVNPFTQGWRAEDQFQRQRESDYLGIDARRFDLGERQRKSSEEQAADALYRDAIKAGGSDGTISGTRSWSAPPAGAEREIVASALDARVRAPAQPAAYAQGERGYSVQELAPPPGVEASAPGQWQPPPGYENRVRSTENPGPDSFARNPRSSAMGNGQFLKGTFLAVWPRIANDPAVVEALGKRGIDPTILHDPNDILMLRGIPEVSDAATRAYAQMNAPGLRSTLGRDPSEGDLRLAHGFGLGGARSLLTADPNAPIEGIVGPKVMAANPHLAGRTVGDVVRQYDSQNGFKLAQQGQRMPTTGPAYPRGGADENAFVQGAMGGPDTMGGAPGTTTPWDAPGTDPAMNAQMRALAATPAFQAASGRDWERDLVAQATGGRAPMAPQSDFLTSRFTNPGMQTFLSGAANTPGMGKAGFEAAQGRYTARDEQGRKVFELIGQGEDQKAMALADAIGMKLPPAVLSNPLMRRAVALVAKIPGLQYDSGAAVRFIREFVKNGGNETAALEAMGDPRSRVDMPVGAGGREPAAIQTAKWLMQSGVAPDEKAAWEMVSTAKTNPERLYRSVFSVLSSQKGITGTPMWTPEQAHQKTMELIQAAQGGMPSATGVAPPAAPVAPAAPAAPAAPQSSGMSPSWVQGGAAMPDAPQAPQISDPLGLRGP